MSKYKCRKCGYSGNKLIFQFNDYSYCVASNETEPEYITEAPQWIEDKALGDREIGNPIACPVVSSLG